jgi:hypothetical protein
MRYRITAVYTPDDVDADRERQETVFEADTKNKVKAAIAGVSVLQLPYADQEGEREAVQAIADPDEQFIAFELFTNNGKHHIVIEPFDVSVEQSVTLENLLAWVRSRCDGSDEQVKSELACVLGRWSWRTSAWCSKHDLQEALHECRLDGCKGYLQMTIDELLDEIFAESEMIEQQRDEYDEPSRPRPFSMDTMIDADKALWLDE